MAAPPLPDAGSRWLAPLVKDLQAHRGQSVVIAGDGQPPVVHALAHAINEALGNVGATVSYTETAELELYDYQADPAETENLAKKKPAVVKELRAILARHPEAMERPAAGRRNNR